MEENKEMKIEENKKLIEEFPFLLPRNRWTDEVSKDYDYSYTELDAMPPGWRKAFGIQMCQEIKNALIKANYLDDYRITQIKEKYGTLRWYDNGHPKEVGDIITKYDFLSMCYCVQCGNPARYVSNGWVNYYCEDCKNKILSHKEVSADFLSRLTEDDIPVRCTYTPGENGEIIKVENEIKDVDFKKLWGLD